MGGISFSRGLVSLCSVHAIVSRHKTDVVNSRSEGLEDIVQSALKQPEVRGGGRQMLQ